MSEKIKNALRKAGSTAAAYGVLAGGAYGAYQILAPHQEARSQEPADPGPDGMVDAWSTNADFDAQTRFLKVAYVVWDNGLAKVSELRLALDQTYDKARKDLGAMFKGEMGAKIHRLEILEGGALALTLQYKPLEGSDLAKYETVRIRYHIGSRKVRGPRFRVAITPDVRILDWEGRTADDPAWRKIVVPATMQPTEKTKSDKPDDCTYPRWNPRGVRYGFYRLSDLPRRFGL